MYLYVVCASVCEYIIQLAVQPLRSLNISFQLKRILREEKTRCRQTNKNNNRAEQEIVERAVAKVVVAFAVLWIIYRHSLPRVIRCFGLAVYPVLCSFSLPPCSCCWPNPICANHKSCTDNFGRGEEQEREDCGCGFSWPMATINKWRLELNYAWANICVA